MASPELRAWNCFLKRHKNPKKEVTIGLVGKYVELQDSYKSIQESFIHAGAKNEVKVRVVCIHSEHVNEQTIEKKIAPLNGIVVAPGFGERGIEGKIKAVRYARENKIPFFGICLGMQMALIEFARNVLGLPDASSTEVDPNTKNPIISLMKAQKNVIDLGGTMRLGAWECQLKPDSIAAEAYHSEKIQERHRHRYEYNTAYRSTFEKAGLHTTGTNPKTDLIEIIELQNHPWFVGVQFHPEYKSTVANPHPLFLSFIQAAVLQCTPKKKDLVK